MREICVEKRSEGGGRVCVRILLPDERRWNRRLLTIGSVGGGGKTPAAPMEDFARAGWAVAGSDAGTAPNPALAGIGRPEVWRDFGGRAVHTTVQEARRAVVSAYGREPKTSVFRGESTGGQQALAAAVRHPDDFDAILCGVPVVRRTALHAYFLWCRRILFPDGTHPLFSPRQWRSVRTGALRVLTRNDPFPGAAGLFYSRRHDSFDAGELDEAVESAARIDASIGPERLAALRKLYGGPRRSDTGERIFCGFPPGVAYDGAVRNLWLFDWAFGRTGAAESFDFGASFDAFTAALAPALDIDSADIDAFRARGGKMIVYAGTMDACTPCPDILDWYEKAVARLGENGGETLRRSLRLCLLPGRTHTGGPGLQRLVRPLDALLRWAERGEEPSLEAAGPTAHATLR